MVKSSPLCVLTATLSESELEAVKKAMGRRKEPLLVAQGPIGSHTKIVTLRRPSSDVDFLGRRRVDGTWQHGILDQLRFLFLDRFLAALKTGSPFPRTIVFFRSFDTLVRVNSWLTDMTGQQTLDETMWCMNHSSLDTPDEAVIHARRDEYLLFLTTNR